MPSADAPLRARLLPAVLGLAVAGALLALSTTSPKPQLTAVATSIAAPVAVQPVLLPPVVVPQAPVAHTRTPRANRSRPLAPLWVRPVNAPVVSPYGPRWGSFHPGIDFGASYGTPIHVVGAGVVIGAGYLVGEDGYGEIVLVQHSPGVVTAYAHCSRIFVHAGQHVVAGQVLALVGATGDATGPHLHFEVRLDGVKVNPVPWLRRHHIWV